MAPADRRTLLRAAAWSSLLLTPLARAAPPTPTTPQLGLPQPFSWDALVERARARAAAVYTPPPPPPRELLEKLDYEALGKIKFKPEDALFADGPGVFPVAFFHLGLFFQSPMHIYAVEGSSAREVVYSPDYFDMPPDSPAHALPQGAGFAGFRVQESRLNQDLEWKKNDWVAFLGASYFRAIGELHQYGLSSRGIAVNVAVPGRPEEFPAFTHIYIQPSSASADQITVFAELDGPSIAGAYRFTMHRTQAVTMEVEASLFLRADIERLGLAPLTSMYWFSETLKPLGIDWRPEVHDSDGLAMWTGAGERIWRALNNPERTTTSAFVDTDPKGFGLLQRDRNFDHYLDGVFYDRRPSLWVEPLTSWGTGAVQLVEIPDDDEIHDNVVAMWVPKDPARAGASYQISYRLHWRADEPFPAPQARCVATRIGRGGQPGRPRPEGVRKFVVEFLGSSLVSLPFGVSPEPVVTTSRGQLSRIFSEAVPDGVAGHWRALFDLAVDGPEPVDLRLYLRNGEQTLTETWMYQYHPF